MKDKMEEQQAEVVFRIENIVIKNLSLETPENVVTPTFKEDPVIKLELRNSSRPLSRDHYYEVVLETTMRAQSGDEVQLLVEVSQAGIFLSAKCRCPTARNFAQRSRPRAALSLYEPTHQRFDDARRRPAYFFTAVQFSRPA